MKHRCCRCKKYFDEDNFFIETDLCFECNKMTTKTILNLINKEITTLDNLSKSSYNNKKENTK